VDVPGGEALNLSLKGLAFEEKKSVSSPLAVTPQSPAFRLAAEVIAKQKPYNHQSHDGAMNRSLKAGYRGLYVDYRSGGFLYDVILHGPAVAATCRF
jgi:hypothetical protein